MSTETTSIHGRIVRISATPKPAAKGGYFFRGIEVVEDETGNRLFVLFPIFTGPELYEFPLLCRVGARISLYNLRFNNRLDDGAAIYSAGPDTEPVLEPYRPVTVMSAVEAGRCVRAADLRLRFGVDDPFAPAKGKLIHQLFERLVSDHAQGRLPDFHELFTQELPSFAAALPGSRVSVDYREFEKDVRGHYDNLLEWLATRDPEETAETEVDTVSVRHGMRGRVDCVLGDGDSKFILELKTGRFTSADHFLQLCAYLLLFADHHPSGIDGCVFYTSTGQYAYPEPNTADLRRVVVNGRNRALALAFSHMEGESPPSEEECPKTGRCFHMDACARFFGVGGKQSPRFSGSEREYYDRWFRLLSIDAWAQEEDFALILDPATLPSRIESGKTFEIARMSPLRRGHAERLDAAKPLLEITPVVDATDIGVRDEVLIHRGDPTHPDAFRARVVALENGAIRALPKRRFSDRDALDEPGWYLDKQPFSRGRDVSRHALTQFFSIGDRTLIDFVVRGNPPEGTGRGSAGGHSPKGHETNPSDDVGMTHDEGLAQELNEDQEAAVRRALEAPRRFLIHGPPGTGKTRVIARLIMGCIHNGERVLVACPTNVALDRVLMGVMRLGFTDFLRVGDRRNASAEFLHELEAQGNPPVFLDEAWKARNDFTAFRKYAHSVRMIGAVAYQCAAHHVFKRMKFDRVIVDEAGQLDEPSTLGPLARAPRFVLAGDHLQLPPVVRASFASDDVPGLERSLFERLFMETDEDHVARLSMQYRMNQEIQDIPSDLFYGGRLRPSPDAASRRLLLPAGLSADSRYHRILDPELPVVFVDIDGADCGKARPEEAAAVAKTAAFLLGGGAPAHEIGIITPYRAQQALIRRSLDDAGAGSAALSVDTVDRFQGGEREVIILSLARSDGVTSFLADRKRLCVSLSRARSKLILMGHGPALKENELFSAMLARIEHVRL